MRSRKLLALLFCLITFPAIAGYMTLLGAGVGSIAPVVSWVSTTDPTFPSSSLTYSGPSLSTMFDSTGKLTYKPNNLALNTATLGTQSVTVQVGTNYLISFASGGGSIALSGAGAGERGDGVERRLVERVAGLDEIALRDRRIIARHPHIAIEPPWARDRVDQPLGNAHAAGDVGARRRRGISA